MRSSITELCLIVGLSLAALVCTSESQAATFYEQSPTITNNYYNTLSSAYTNSNFDFFFALDDFRLTQNSLLTGISWQGAYLNFDSSTGNVSNGSPNSNAWMFAIYTSGGSANFPYTLVSSQTIDSSNVTESFAGTTFYNNPNGSVPLDYYEESVQLSTGITLNANTTYYLGIFSVNAGSTTRWSWFSGTGGNGVSFQYSTYTNTTSARQFDRTFALSGTPVPEPAAWITSTIGLIAFGCLRFRNHPRFRSIRN